MEEHFRYFCFVELKVCRRGAHSADGRKTSVSLSFRRRQQKKNICTTFQKFRTFVKNSKMAKNGGKSGQVRIAVPEQIRQWAKDATMIQRANGQRGVSVMLVLQTIVNRVAETGFVEYLKDVDPEQLKDIRGRPKNKAA